MREQHCLFMQRIALWMEIVNIWLIWGGGRSVSPIICIGYDNDFDFEIDMYL